MVQDRLTVVRMWIFSRTGGKREGGFSTNPQEEAYRPSQTDLQ
jgi:hypothetical protein